MQLPYIARERVLLSTPFQADRCSCLSAASLRRIFPSGRPETRCFRRSRDYRARQIGRTREPIARLPAIVMGGEVRPAKGAAPPADISHLSARTSVTLDHEAARYRPSRVESLDTHAPNHIADPGQPSCVDRSQPDSDALIWTRERPFRQRACPDKRRADSTRLPRRVPARQRGGDQSRAGSHPRVSGKCHTDQGHR